eukprot:TRINITY_DN3471_c0_g1_i1.p1 TRINITY_DN3471_c0_g1~~TRINITY_DN3471_c0_g1_i1.p1  ORF type:complete len:281 (-),score=37.36 TRINITY_DN3471_c0_g1_i1:174-1016(-)
MTEDATSMARIAVTYNIICCHCSSLCGCLACKARKGYYDLCDVCNCVLTGLVAILVACATVQPILRCLIGIIAGLTYEIGIVFMEKMKIDDPLDAASVHGFGGLWGMLSTGLFSNESMIREVYPDARETWLSRSYFARLWPQIVVSIILILWSGGGSFTVFYAIDKAIGLRVTEDVERAGLDSQHDGEGWLIVARRVTTSYDLDEDDHIELGIKHTSRSKPIDGPADTAEKPQSVREHASSVQSSVGSDYTIDDVFRNDSQVMLMTTDAGIPGLSNESSC